MKDNCELCLVGKLVTLIPYRKEHVEKYHEWMQDPFLLESTSSEPLSLEEEYEMQKNWVEDSKKCTFIILDNRFIDFSIDPFQIQAMVGDVNLFLNDADNPFIGEIEIMIAEKRSRGMGLGKEAVKMMMAYAFKHHQIQTFKSIIDENNHVSLHLFKSMGFVEKKKMEVFHQISLELDTDTGSEKTEIIFPELKFQEKYFSKCCS